MVEARSAPTPQWGHSQGSRPRTPLHWSGLGISIENIFKGDGLVGNAKQACFVQAL